MNKHLSKKPLCLAVLVGLLLTMLNGCISFQTRDTIDVTEQAAWWGELTPNETVQLRSDLLVGPGGLLQPKSYIAHSDYHDESVTVEQYKANPAKWPSLRLVEIGTKLQCLNLKRYYNINYKRYKLEAKIVNGNLVGRIVDIGWWLTFGDPDQKGSLRLDPKYLEPVN